jgi:hypothetical protein
MDFRKLPVGTKVALNNLSNDNNRDFDNTNKIMRFDVVAEGVLPPDDPSILRSPRSPAPSCPARR